MCPGPWALLFPCYSLLFPGVASLLFLGVLQYVFIWSGLLPQASTMELPTSRKMLPPVSDLARVSLGLTFFQYRSRIHATGTMQRDAGVTMASHSQDKRHIRGPRHSQRKGPWPGAK